MRLDGRRESSNVEDRRGSGGKIAGLGIGGVIIVGILTLLMGGDLGDVFNNVTSMGSGTEVVSGGGDDAQFTAEEQELARFSRIILASTEDVWTASVSTAIPPWFSTPDRPTPAAARGRRRWDLSTAPPTRNSTLT